MSLSEPIVVLDGLLQRAGNNTNQLNRVALSPPITISVLGDFTMTNSVHFLEKGTPGGGKVNVDNIYGANPGELLLLFGDKVRLKKGGNLFIPTNFVFNIGRSLLLYWTGPPQDIWVPVSAIS